MARFKKFAGGTKIDDFEALGFEVNGSEFEAVPAIPGTVLLDFIKDADSDSGGDSARALYNFFEKVLEDDDYRRFRGVLDDPKVIIDLEFIGEIASWLVSEYSARPTTPPSPSSSGESTPGTTSTDEPSPNQEPGFIG